MSVLLYTLVNTILPYVAYMVLHASAISCVVEGRPPRDHTCLQTMSMIHLQSPAASAKKLVPRSSSIPVPFSYEPSKDGIDENLLILLHGLGALKYT